MQINCRLLSPASISRGALVRGTCRHRCCRQEVRGVVFCHMPRMMRRAKTAEDRNGYPGHDPCPLGDRVRAGSRFCGSGQGARRPCIAAFAEDPGSFLDDAARRSLKTSGSTVCPRWKPSQSISACRISHNLCAMPDGSLCRNLEDPRRAMSGCSASSQDGEALRLNSLYQERLVTSASWELEAS